ncbi:MULTISPECIES: glutamate synthase subunit beta [Thermomonospora]|mgnify:CR=1 FL=1|uniref:Glutamate synthase, NADH/NADPH, small subunit n=1 Tax=Thermomonospora curvata (strain ATCC 19995 / DSM 43183 / JCM 3096 / KCTC 9072 / NBRC 15933 / NCIMB 10081 / Henssen B9) TaxID=471852 RepID=D1A706_THECD|nr:MULTISPECIES: glutamate synthase subunit beta [Thermomonospora]ACY98410.1 glutamate synthase, NADH/NADPH, small subunit [Thermomonospora curvata DSM 43183]PKK13561.1 MAG: glutamate synthase subunit beta [Thermomonospora sp. CIF 1]
MADPKGFLTVPRELPKRRPVDVRIKNWREVYEDFDRARLERQASRCMDCGIPFCHQGCPLGNLIPEWNDLVYRSDWRDAIERLHATNNFPEFTGKLCPAPCEAACVLGINSDPVTIKRVEAEIIDRAWEEGWVTPKPPAVKTGKKVAIVGSGPAGLAAAQQLTRAGHDVTVYERADRIGGLLRYGIPEFKMEKRHLDRRLAQMRAEGTEFVTSVEVGVDITAEELRARYDAILLAGGATVRRDLPVPGRDLAGIYQAMEYLPEANRVQEGDRTEPLINAAGKDVVVIGGGDTGADCIGTAIRQGARSVTQLEIMPKPPEQRPPHQPWPTYPILYKTESAHEELADMGGQRLYALSTVEFLGDEHGHVRALKVVGVEGPETGFKPIPGTEREIPAQLVTLAMGFLGPQREGLLQQLGVEFDQRGNVARDDNYATNVEGVFVAGDMGRGQSLIVWAIAEGRSAASGIDAYLTGSTTLPRPIPPTARPIS